MSRIFYYHPSRQVEVDKVIAANMLGARPGEKCAPNAWMPTISSDGKPLLGFWVEDVLTDEGMKIKEISAPLVDHRLFEYGEHLLRYADLITGIQPAPEGSISRSIEASAVLDEAQRAQWALGDYAHTGCENCGRMRVCACPNGKHRCEKCNWVPEDQFYCPVSL